ncbi:ABC transporter ATP-binding protein [Occultella aeris]|uniref:Lipid A export ATP-binding/permease protein MsbA n=2 Tax=Occultella aeris TaxID=2761496 RepID=A0A7M4DN87_9MICO|nr:Lipid A export ATP-binding/permease protein MsbA [Occultella aeris]
MRPMRLAADMMARCWRASPGRTAIILIAIIVQFSSSIVLAVLQRTIVNSAGSQMITLVAVAGVGLALAMTADHAANRIQTNLRATVDTRVAYALAHDLAIWATTNPQLDLYDRPDVLDRMHRVRAQHRSLVGLGWSVILTAAVSVNLVASLVLLAQISPWLIGVAVLAVPPLILSQRSRRHLQGAIERSAPAERQEARLHALTSNPEQAAELRISRNESTIDDRCRSLWQDAQGMLRRGHLRAGVTSYAGSLIFTVGYLGSITLTVALVIGGDATLGDLALVLGIGETLRWRVFGVVANMSAVTDGGRVAREYLLLREEYEQALRPDRAVGPPDRLAAGIGLRGVTYRYPDHQRPAVGSVTVDLPAGSVIALLGENGAGKTTLVKLLLGQYTPQSGRITIDGTDLQTMDPRAWATRCSGLVQDFAKLQGPVRESVSAAALRPLNRTEIRTAIDHAHAGPIIDGLPDGLDTRLGLAYGTASLSHGQWQRLALARGLTRTTPLLLVLDEPTSALDPEVEHQLFDSFFRRARQVATTHGAIALVVSHRLSTTQDADLIIVMDHGHIVEVGDHAALIDADGRYAELFRLQSNAYR